MADGQALHIVADFCAREQDLWRQGAELTHSPLVQSGHSLAANRGCDVGRTSTALGAFHRRLAARIGKAKAVTATARKIAVLFYNTLRHGTAYKDPGADYYEERFRRRTIDNLRRRASALGFNLVTSEPAVGGVS